MNKAGSLYLTNRINENSYDQHKLFKTVKSLLSDSKSLLLAVNINPKVAANSIRNYFVQKVNDIYDHLTQNNTTITVYPEDEVADNREFKQIATAIADTGAGSKFPPKCDTALVRRLHPAVARNLTRWVGMFCGSGYYVGFISLLWPFSTDISAF